MQIHDLATETGEDVEYSSEFHVVLESHLTYLRNLETLRIYPVEPFLAYKYEGDFYGFLDEIKIPKKYHYITLLINNYRSTGDFKDGTQSILMPDFTEIDLIKAIYQTKMTKN